MASLLGNPERALQCAHLLLAGGLAGLLLGVLLAYVLDSYLTLPVLLAAHLLTILGPTAIKLGYVLRLQVLSRRKPVVQKVAG